MKDFFKRTFTFLGVLTKQLLIYIIVVVTATASFFIGKNYTKLTKKPETTKAVANTRIEKSDITLAINEQNELMMINKKSGLYTIYSDSIGVAIFSLYTKNLWREHSPTK